MPHAYVFEGTKRELQDRLNQMGEESRLTLIFLDGGAETELAAEFEQLAHQWRRETSHLSNSTKMALHPAYQRIIGMGQAALPLILEELKRKPDHWFWALNAISGADPAQTDADFDGAVAAWLQWGREEGYIR